MSALDGLTHAHLAAALALAYLTWCGLVLASPQVARRARACASRAVQP